MFPMKPSNSHTLKVEPDIIVLYFKSPIEMDFTLGKGN